MSAYAQRLCPHCGLLNFSFSSTCRRCENAMGATHIPFRRKSDIPRTSPDVSIAVPPPKEQPISQIHAKPILHVAEKTQYRGVSLWRIQAAWSIDILAISCVTYAYLLLFSLVNYLLHTSWGFFQAFPCALVTYQSAVLIYYGKTLGQWLTRTQFVTTHGKIPSRKLLFLRALCMPLSVALFCMGFFWMLIDPWHKTLHDNIAGLVLVRKI